MIDRKHLEAIRQASRPCLDDLRKAYVAFVVEQHGGDKLAASLELEMGRSTVYTALGRRRPRRPAREGVTR